MTQGMAETATDAAGIIWTQRPDGGWTTTPPLPEPPATANEALARVYAEYGKPAVACRAFVQSRMPPWARSKNFLWPLEPRHRWELLERMKEVVRTHTTAHTAHSPPAEGGFHETLGVNPAL
jgi:hypothetical protein